MNFEYGKSKAKVIKGWDNKDWAVFHKKKPLGEENFAEVFPFITKNIFDDICYKSSDGNGTGLSNKNWDAASCLGIWKTKNTFQNSNYFEVLLANGNKPIASYTYDKMWTRLRDDIFIHSAININYQTNTPYTYLCKWYHISGCPKPEWGLNSSVKSVDGNEYLTPPSNRLNPKPYFQNRNKIKYLHNDFTKYELEDWLKNITKVDEVKNKFKTSQIAAFAYKIWEDPLATVKTDMDYVNNQKTADLNNWLNSKNRLVKKLFADSTIAKTAYTLWLNSQYNNSYDAKVSKKIWVNSAAGKTTFNKSTIAAVAYDNYEGVNDDSKTAYKASKMILSDLSTWITAKSVATKTAFLKWIGAKTAYTVWNNFRESKYTEAKYWSNVASNIDKNIWVDAKKAGLAGAKIIFKNWDLAIKNWKQWKSNQYLADGNNANIGKSNWFNKDEAFVEFKKSLRVVAE